MGRKRLFTAKENIERQKKSHARWRKRNRETELLRFKIYDRKRSKKKIPTTQKRILIQRLIKARAIKLRKLNKS